MSDHLAAIHIENIQSHRKTTVELHPGVNAIVGPTNAGKSVIIRSIKKVAQNRPLGEAFRSHWGGRSLVELEFSDGETIGWMKEDKATYYRGDVDYVAFKTDVPEEIQEGLNLDRVNLQEQMDLPFLLSDSAAEVSKVLNRAANLTKIDSSISNIRKRLLSNSGDIKAAEDTLKELENRAGSFQYLDQMEKDVKHYEDLLEYGNDLNEDTAALANLVSQIKELTTEVDVLDSFLRAEQEMSLALSLTEESKSLLKDIRALISLTTKIGTDQNEVKEIEDFLKAEADCGKAMELVERTNEIYDQHKELCRLVKEIKQQEAWITEDEHNLKITEGAFSREFPEHCPLCGK